MSNVVNKIIAFSSDSPISATTENGGSTWTQTDSGTLTWKTIAGNDTGKFIYTMVDTKNPYAIVDYSIVDDTNWLSGVLPIETLDCIVAVADNNHGGIYTSFDGVNFSQVTTLPTINYAREYGGNKIFQTCFAQSISTSRVWTAVNAQLFFATCIATSNSLATAIMLKCRLITASAFTEAKATFSRISIFNRTFATSVSSIVTRLMEFIW